MLVGMQTGAATVQSSMELPQNLKMEKPHDPAIQLLGIYPKKAETLIQKNTHIFVYCSIIYNSQDLEHPMCPSVNEWIR